jgi:hypothetical protein
VYLYQKLLDAVKNNENSACLLHVVSSCLAWNKLFDPVQSDWLNYGGGVSHIIVKHEFVKSWGGSPVF